MDPGGAPEHGGHGHWVLALLLVAGFFSAYGFASSHGASSTALGPAALSAGPVVAGRATPVVLTRASERTFPAQSGVTQAPECCGVSGPVAIVATAAVQGGIQRVAIDVSRGYYDPSEVHASAGMPIELDFGKATGCLGTVVFESLHVTRDLRDGAVVRLPALKPGAYEWHCGHSMVYGRIVVR
jgi:hypothetical protein